MSNSKFPKIKVVWICHFTNQEIQSILPLWKKKNEFAPWIPNLLKGFEKKDNIEIFVISPHDHLKKLTRFRLRNINYIFIPFGVPLLHRHWPHFLRLDILSDFTFFRKKVKKIVKEINPDIINLMGAENSYYSSSILDYLVEFPVLILIQGFISQFKEGRHLPLELHNRIKVEETILKKFRYFCGEQDSSVYISFYNPTHVFSRLYFPVNEELVSITTETYKKYDCIYFGRLDLSKGAGDFIKVIGELKKQMPGIRGCLIGEGNIAPYRSLAKKLDCENNIDFVGFVNSQKELFQYVKSSKVFLAPPYKERLSSTIREAMMLKVPVVAYATGGIPYINEFDENIYLVKTGDYKEMADKTLALLIDEKKAELLSSKAFNYSNREFSLEENAKRIINTYYQILNRNPI